MRSGGQVLDGSGRMPSSVLFVWLSGSELKFVGGFFLQ